MAQPKAGRQRTKKKEDAEDTSGKAVEVDNSDKSDKKRNSKPRGRRKQQRPKEGKEVDGKDLAPPEDEDMTRSQEGRGFLSLCI